MPRPTTPSNVLLALDTTNDYAGVAIYTPAGLLGERSWRSGRGHAEQVLEAADQLLRDCGLGPQSLSVVAAALGPGSWSGLRVGLSLAKGLAVARELPIIGVDSLEVLAYPHQRFGRPVVAVIGLGRGRYAAAEYRLKRRWTRVGEPRNLSLEELVAGVPDVSLVCGDVDDELQAALKKAHGAGIVIEPPALNTRRAGYLAELAWTRHRAGSYDDLVALEPLYLGSPIKEKG